MAENIKKNSYLSRQVESNTSGSSLKQTLILGLSGSLNGGAAYSYIVSLGYFTPSVGIVAGMLAGFGIAAGELFSDNEKYDEDIPLKKIVIAVLFGIIALFLGYVLVYYFVKLPIPIFHGTILSIPAEEVTIAEFFKATMKIEDIIGAILGSISSLATPLIFKEKFRNLMKKLKISPFYSVSK